MLKTAALTLAVTMTLIATAQAGGRDRYRAPAPYAGQVHNYYGPVTVYNGSGSGYRYDYSNAYPAYAPSSSYGYGASYGSAYANAYGQAYGSYGADYGAPWGPPFAGGVGYSPYGNYGGYGYGSVYGARMDPWNGYNGGFGNGYW
jgi:hypothetical protein